MYLVNHGKRVARYAKAILDIPCEAIRHFAVVQGASHRLDHLHEGKHVVQFTDNEGVIYPGLPSHMFTVKFCVTHDYAENQPQDPFVSWQIFCDEMEAKEGVLSLADLRALSPPGTDR